MYKDRKYEGTSTPNLNSEDEGKTVEFYIPVEEENAVIGFQEETPKPEYTWEDLAKGGRTPTYWIEYLS